MLHACGDVSAWPPRQDQSDGLLHACGDVSLASASTQPQPQFAPRMWRCFGFFEIYSLIAVVCSTHVEMFLRIRKPRMPILGLLHACGDVSGTASGCRGAGLFAPRMWRCFLKIRLRSSLTGVCSTHVEMFPASSRILQPASCLLHACGDVSQLRADLEAIAAFAPRMWRCFSA